MAFIYVEAFWRRLSRQPKSRAWRGVPIRANGKGSMLFTWSLHLCRRRPTLPHTFACSTIGPAGLDFRVRDGNGYFPRGKITGKLRRLRASEPAAEIPSAFSEGSLSQASHLLAGDVTPGY